MYLKVEGKIVGVLNDFDLASTQETTTGTERTGTVPFTALALLRDEALQGNVIRAYEHDTESFIWVLIWISLRYELETAALRLRGSSTARRLLATNRPLFAPSSSFRAILASARR